MEKKFIINHLLRPHWKWLALAFVAVIVAGLADLFDPWPIKIVLDYVVGSHPLPAWVAATVSNLFGAGKLAVLNFAALTTVAVAALGAVASYSESCLTMQVGQWVMRDLRQTLYHHIQGLSLSYYDQHKTGDLISRVTSDVDAIQSFITSGLLGMVVDVLTLAGMMAVMLYFNWHFTLIALSVAPLLFLEVYTLTRRIKQATREVRKKEGDVLSVVQETLSSMRVVKAFAREDYEERRLAKETLETIELTVRARKVKALLAPAVDFVVAGGASVVLWYGARLVLKGQLTGGALVVFLLYLGKLYKPMRDLSKMTDAISKALIGAERINEVIKTEELVRDSPRARRAPRFSGAISFEHVFFHYRDDRPVLKDVSFQIRPGEFAAFVGPTGAGKSTIISLIPRFYTPHFGRVLIDGEDVRNFTLKSLRQQISFVLQDTVLFRTSIWQNIAYGRPEATRQEILRAARQANAHEFIEQMPEGYETLVGERGMTLSGGQRQRLAIARALIRNSPILILDEPTSGLDASSEKLVMEALGRLMHGKTSIMIAHNLETVRKADAIYVLENGRIVEAGQHPALLARAGLYAQLYASQFGGEEQADVLSV
ncbi:MAG: ABC transporter ATP-binding protein [Acidobacteria bacterium]|nr:ABC transporter ATP-binding protein [Acidobacteriota bacterium]MBI3425903.1 ABC transporter ATP-binding protein [Acidobacteriota bacterium]